MRLLLHGLRFPPWLWAWQDAELGADRGQFQRQDGDRFFLWEWGDRLL